MELGTRNCTGVALTLLLLAPAMAAAQGAECASLDCGAAGRASTAAYTRFWTDAAAIHRLKLEFVDALQAFTRSQAGTFGDEGESLRSSVAAMRQTLVRWDEAVRQFQAEATRTTPAAELHVAVATVLLDRYRIEDALRELKAAERFDDNRTDIYILQALAYGVSARPREASRALRRAAALDPANPATLYTLAQSLTRQKQSADAARALRDFQRALDRRASKREAAEPARFDRLDLLRQAAGVAPIFPQARYVDGFAALRSGDYTKAVALFSDASVADPLLAGDPAARQHVTRAAALLREGRLDVALAELRRGISEAPNHAEAHRLLGLAYSLDGQVGKSIEHLRSAIRLAPDDERARVALADVLAEDRRLAEAERELLQALETDPNSGRVRYQLARLYERQSSLPQAAKSFHESEAFGPIIGRDEFYRALGSLLVNQADFDGAVDAYMRRIDANPNSADAHRQLAEIYYLQGRDDEALGEFLAATWLDPRDAKALAGIGQVQARLLKYPEAVTYLQRALAVDPSLKEARYALGTSLMRLGKTDEGRKELDAFQRKQSDNEAIGQRAFELDALRREASKSLLSGASDQAIAAYKSALEIDPTSARSHRDFGIALLRAKRPEDAIAPLTEAQRLEETVEGYAYLAEAYAASGDREESARQRALGQQFVIRTKQERIRELSR
jgi:tetratricopeptide (TPR) repeat protein